MDTFDDIDIDPAFGHWLAGFIDGEGCFQIARNHKRGTYSPRFTIHLRDDDEPILREVQERLGGIGYLARHKVYGNSKPQISWVIDSKVDCLAFVHVMDRFSLRAKKAKDYGIWRKAIFAWTQQNRRSNKELMTEFFNQLSDARLYVESPLKSVISVR